MANQWQRFHWNLESGQNIPHPVLPPFVFRRAESGELEPVMKVVSSAMLMERAATKFRRDLERRCAQVFEGEAPACVVVQHGTRLIGASVLDLSPDSDSHLITGPCVLHEYRSRGFGTALLQQSLERLREEGLRQVVAMARVNSTVARFVYPKFGGTHEPETPRLAA
jgi:ribosomal protein S18 acetylase RimI-like enzyme